MKIISFQEKRCNRNIFFKGALEKFSSGFFITDINIFVFIAYRIKLIWPFNFKLSPSTDFPVNK